MLLLLLLFGFSASGWFAVGGVCSGHTVGVGMSKMVLRRFEWRPEDMRGLGFRVGVSTSDSEVQSSSR